MKGNMNTTWMLAAGVLVIAVVAIVAVVNMDTTGQSGNGLGPAFAYNLDELKKVDPKLILYDLTGTFDTGMQEVHAIATDTQGRIYVAGDKAVRIFSDSGARQGEIEVGQTPWCLAYSPKGTLYVGIGGHVELYDVGTARKAVWPSLGEKAQLTSIAVAPAAEGGEEVFLADAGNRCVVKCDAAGKVLGRIGPAEASGKPTFVVPSPFFDVAIGVDGLLKVADPGRHLVKSFLPSDLSLKQSWGRQSDTDITGFCGCCNPINFAMLPDGGFVTAEKGLKRVKVYGADGEFVGVVAGPASFADDPGDCGLETCTGKGLDVAVDAAGGVLVLDRIARKVLIFVRKNAPGAPAFGSEAQARRGQPATDKANKAQNQ